MGVTANEDRVFDSLLEATEKLNEQGVETAEIARGTAAFLVQVSFDCVPSSDHAVHLILSAITQRIERNFNQ